MTLITTFFNALSLEQIEHLLSLISLFFFGWIKFVPTAIIAIGLGYSFTNYLLLCIISGLSGFSFFMFFGKVFQKKLRQWGLVKIDPTKIRMNKVARWIVIIRKRFGTFGIAMLTPVLIQIPIGAIICSKIEKKVWKSLVYITISLIFWALVFYGFYYFGKQAI